MAANPECADVDPCSHRCEPADCDIVEFDTTECDIANCDNAECDTTKCDTANCHNAECDTSESDQPGCGQTAIPKRFRPSCTPRGLKGYGRPVQHPLYTTTSSQYGQHAPPLALQVKSGHTKSNKFTTIQSCGGNYLDMHFSTDPGCS